MLDVAYLRENLDTVKENCKNRNVVADVDTVITFDDQRKKLRHEAQQFQQEANELQKKIKGTKDADERQQLIEKGRELRQQVSDLEEQVKDVEQQLRQALNVIPNITHPDAPVGTDDSANKVIKKHGEPTKFDFTPKDHYELCEALDLADFEAGSNVVGPKFYYLKNEGALLEIALVQYAMQKLVEKGFVPIITPDMAKAEVLEGIGFIPRGEETQIYSIENTDLCMIATAEITLGGMHKDKILQETDLPQRYVGLSHCFRTEAGAAGRDTRGLYRVHQFTKVEMFAFCVPEQSDAIHEDILAIEEEIFQGLGLPYHVIDTCTGDLGGPAYRKYDIEAWMPGRGEGGEYGEVTSTSNCTDYQARRLNIRYKGPDFKGTRFVHTLNGTAVASTRAILAILENYQQEDGSVLIPEALQKWVGKDKISR
ncbi:MAG: serine--tRNA ligase [Gemmataceae bacterium]